MPKTPVEFTFADHRFRHTPLMAMPLAREFDKLRIRLDHESGTLGTLAYTLEDSDLDDMVSLSPTGVAKIVNLVSRLVDGNQPNASTVDDGDDAKPRDELPRKLDELLLYFLRAGDVQFASSLQGSDALVWHDLQTEEQVNSHPVDLAAFVCAGYVIGGLFAPFADRFRAWYDKAKAGPSTPSTPNSAETDEATAPTSLT